MTIGCSATTVVEEFDTVEQFYEETGIRITEEMLDAGANVLFYFEDGAEALSEVAAEVFTEMMRVHLEKSEKSKGKSSVVYENNSKIAWGIVPIKP